MSTTPTKTIAAAIQELARNGKLSEDTSDALDRVVGTDASGNEPPPESSDDEGSTKGDK